MLPAFLLSIAAAADLATLEAELETLRAFRIAVAEEEGLSPVQISRSRYHRLLAKDAAQMAFARKARASLAAASPPQRAEILGLIAASEEDVADALRAATIPDYLSPEGEALLAWLLARYARGPLERAESAYGEALRAAPADPELLDAEAALRQVLDEMIRQAEALSLLVGPPEDLERDYQARSFLLAQCDLYREPEPELSGDWVDVRSYAAALPGPGRPPPLQRSSPTTPYVYRSKPGNTFHPWPQFWLMTLPYVEEKPADPEGEEWLYFSRDEIRARCPSAEP